VKLIDEAKQAYKFFSVQAMALAIAIQGAWEVIPADMKASIPPQYVTYTTLALLVLGIFGRFVKQK
jgi:hypothetical protein